MSTDCPLPSFLAYLKFWGFSVMERIILCGSREDLVLPLPPLVWPEGLLLLLESEQ